MAKKNKIKFFTDPDDLPPDHLLTKAETKAIDDGVKEIVQKLKNQNNER
jgi:hypothetical protein